MIKTYYYNHADNAFYHDVDLDQKNELLNSPDNLLWIDMYNGTTKELEYIGQVFDFHPLAIEDCLQENPRAKVDHYDGYNFSFFMPFVISKNQAMMMKSPASNWMFSWGPIILLPSIPSL